MNKMPLSDTDFVHNIEKLRRITQKIAKFDINTTIGLLETHEKLLQNYWENCISASIDTGDDVPFDDAIFWWQTEGELRYIKARENVTWLLMCYRVHILTTSHTCVTLTRLTNQIYYFNESTLIPVLQRSADLLEQFWMKYFDSYSEIVNGNFQPQFVSNRYYEIEYCYMNAQLKLKLLFHHHSQMLSVISKDVENGNETSKDSFFKRIFSIPQKFYNLFIDWVRRQWQKIFEWVRLRWRKIFIPKNQSSPLHPSLESEIKID